MLMQLAKIYQALVLGLSATLSLSAQTISDTLAPAKDWQHHWSPKAQGTRSAEALHFLQEARRKPRPILVAVIDTGVDTTLQELRHALYLQPQERPNGKDDDGDGYIDNRYGWNFLGSADGLIELTSVGTSAFREYKRLYPRYKNLRQAPAGGEEEYAYFRRMARLAGIDRYEQLQQVTARKVQAFHFLDSALRRLPAIPEDSLTIERFLSLPLEGEKVEAAAEIIASELFKADKKTRWSQLLQRTEAHLRQINERLSSIESEPDKRTLLGDDMNRLDSRSYGNGRVAGPGMEHGTFVASVLAGAGTVDSLVRGIYPAAKLLTLRAVPDRGDEYDKDVAAAIVYAVDHGAKIINLSLGKDLSPAEKLVQEAMDYAARHDVLVIHSSGNNGRLLDERPIFPSGLDKAGRPYPNYLRIGASTPEGKRASFSNYGRSVCLYAPGLGIWGTMPGGRLAQEDGTSIAAPIASGVAALIRAYYPRLTAAQTAQLLLRTARAGEVPLLDALAAVQAASSTKSLKP